MYRSLSANDVEDICKRANEEGAKIISVWSQGIRVYAIVEGGEPKGGTHASDPVSFRPAKRNVVREQEAEAPRPEVAKPRSEPKPRVEPKPNPEAKI